MNKSTPKFWTGLFKRFCDDDFFEELQGDLEEKFYENVEHYGARKARSLYRAEVIKMIRPSVLSTPKFMINLSQLSLFQIHLKLAFRNIYRHKVFSAVNIFGLAAALSASLFLVNILYTGHTMDTHHPDYQRLYKASTLVNSNSGNFKMATVAEALTDKVKAQIPEIVALTEIKSFKSETFMVSGEEVRINGFHTDPVFFELFAFSAIRGDVQIVFNDINSIAISEPIAKRLFPEEDPIGKITKNGKVVRAVLETPQGQSHISFDFIGNLKADKSPDKANQPNEWDAIAMHYLYFKIAKGASQEAVQQKLANISREANLENRLKERSYQFQAQKITDIIFGEQEYYSLSFHRSGKDTVIFYVLLAVLLFLAGFNYTNMSIARALQRTKEVGIRKVVGSSRLQVISQFLAETIVFSITGLLLGYVLYYSFLPSFIRMAPDMEAFITPGLNVEIIIVFILFSVGIGIISGLLPSLYFARISPLEAFNTRIKTRKISLLGLRKVLVTFQLVLSMCGILFISIGVSQYKTLLSTAFNFDSEQVVVLEADKSSSATLKQELLRVPGVAGISIVSSLPGMDMTSGFDLESVNGQDTIFSQSSMVDPEFDAVFKPSLLSGSFFDSTTHRSANLKIIVDQNFVKSAGMSVNGIIGEQFRQIRGNAIFEVIGVVDDFVFGSLMNGNAVPKVILHVSEPFGRNLMAIKLQGGNTLASLNKLEDVWKTVEKEKRFNPVFLDKKIAESYQGLKDLIQILAFVSIVIISISLLGQLGMALYNAETRVKEIGIRKILGATVNGITGRLLRGTLISLFIAALIATPAVVYFFQENILINMKVTTPIGVTELGRGILALSFLVILLVIIQTRRVATANPSNSLRNE